MSSYLREVFSPKVEGYTLFRITEGMVSFRDEDFLGECEICGAIVRFDKTTLHTEHHTNNDKFTEIVESLQRMTRT